MLISPRLPFLQFPALQVFSCALKRVDRLVFSVILSPAPFLPSISLLLRLLPITFKVFLISSLPEPLTTP